MDIGTEGSLVALETGNSADMECSLGYVAEAVG
jgi:hypothetical protein